MYHFFVTASQVQGEQILVTGSDVNHMKNVLRMKEGEQVEISDGNNKSYLCSISGFLPEEVVLHILETHESENELSSRIVLFQGIPKVDKMELIVQKAVELGAYSVVPVAMKRCVAKIEPKKEESKLKRWQSISESAAKQAGRNIVPEVQHVMSMKEAISYAKTFDHVLLPYELAENMSESRAILDKIAPGESIAVFIGPEGGFDTAEADVLRENGAEVITLGKRILRTETAGLAILSVLMFKLQ